MIVQPSLSWRTRPSRTLRRPQSKNEQQRKGRRRQCDDQLRHSAPEGARNRGCADFPKARRRPDASLGATEARKRQAVQQGHRRSRAQDGRLRMACAPNFEMEASFTRKLELLGTRIGRDELRAQGFADKRKFAASIARLFYPKASTSSASHDAYAEIKANAGGLCEGPSDRLGTPPRVKKPASSSLTTQRTARVHTKAEDCRNLEDKP